MIHVSIDIPNPNQHELEITISFKTHQKSIDLFLPRWRPGRYEAADFALNISKFEAQDTNENLLPWSRLQSNGWRIELGEVTEWSVKYNYYAFKMDAGNSVADSDQVYINFVNCIMHADELMKEEILLIVGLPDSYEVACALSLKHDNQFTASDIHELYDSPLLASDRLKTLSYEVASTQFKIIFMGDHPLDDVQLIEDFKKFTNHQCEVMGGFPCQQYLFLIQSLDYTHYHGVEHQRSTVLVLGPNDDASIEQYYEKLMGVASHELFHSWNVTRIRPFEMSPYNYKDEITFDTGFIAEGFTTYYGDLFLTTSGTYSVEQYLKEVTILCNRHFPNFGRHRISLIGSSNRLWLDGYKNLFPSNKVSIYVKGALASLILDLTIRKTSNHQYALIDVVKKMYDQHRYSQGGYTWQDTIDLFREIGGDKIVALLKLLVESTQDIAPYLIEALSYAGVQLDNEPLEDCFLTKTGIKTENGKIIDIHPDSTFHSLCIGDEIIHVNGNKFDHTQKLQAKNTIEFKRNHSTLKADIMLIQENYAQKYHITLSKNANKNQLDFLAKWLNN